MSNNISFGKLYLGGGQKVITSTQKSVAQFSQNDPQIINKLGELFQTIDSQTGEDTFILRSNVKDGKTKFDLNTKFTKQSKHIYKFGGGGYENEQYTKIFQQDIPTTASKEEKINFLDGLIKKFQQDKNSGKYYAINLTQKYNANGPLTVERSKNQVEKIAEVINGDQQTADALEQTIEDISELLKLHNGTAIFDALSSKNTLSEKAIVLNVKSPLLSQNCGRVHIYKSDTKEQKLEKFQQMKQDISDELNGVKKPAVSDEYPEGLKELFSKYC